MHAAKLTLAATMGIPLARRGNGLTVLLEKVFGNIYIDKMRAICLLEADYNWLNKFVFAKQMMDRAFKEEIIPAEQFAKRGSQATEGLLTSGLFCDIARALHRTAAIESVDLANCYDAVAHPIASIALQSFKVRKVMVAMMLYVLEKMTWYLKTAFGQSKISFGGTKWDPSMGLGQGNGAAPPGFLAVCTLMINVYRNLGHGVTFVGAWTRDAFILAAVLYVDDSDLFHMTQGMPTDDEFLDLVQRATDDWAGLVHATGGSLKPQKCFWYMLGWLWKKGRARLKTLAELPQTPLQIPQPDGTRVPIVLKKVDCPKKKLGIYTCPTGDFSYHVSQLVETGSEYAARLSARHLPARDAWMGTHYQLFPKLIYGAAAVTHAPQALEDAYQSIWYKLLPSLRVNRNITKEYRMLPLRFQGLALPNPNIESLSRKIHLLQTNWDTGSTIGKMLHQAYQVFQVEVGLGGNIFSKSYVSFQGLATHGFFRNLWELLERYGILFHLHADFDIPLLRERDRTLMDAVCETGIFTKQEIISINRSRHYKGVHSIGDMTYSDGLSMDPTMYTRRSGTSVRDFPLQHPTGSDHNTWLKAIGSLTQAGQKLRCPLGKYTGKLHRPDDWFVSSDL
jgi:hypothetical protein